jgi:hypothetical protein
VAPLQVLVCFGTIAERRGAENTPPFLINATCKGADMTTQNLPSVEYLRKRLRYEPETGKLYWLDCEDMPNCWRGRYAGVEAFTSDSGNGYQQGSIDGRTYQAHRVIWARVTGAWPAADIDHINGDKLDNRIENLRVVSRAENSRNASKRVNNTSGVCGVSWHKNRGKWQALVVVQGKYHHLGLFTSFDDAVAARKAAAREHGFTDRHGT